MDEPKGPTVAHLRVVMPEGYRGQKALGHPAQVFITLPGDIERRLPATVSVEPFVGVSDALQAKVVLLATTEIVYEHVVVPADGGGDG